MSLTSVANIAKAKSVGASQTAGVLDISPFSDPWREWNKIINPLDDPGPPADYLRLGLKLQRPLAELFTEDTNIAHEWFDKRIYNDDYPWRHASPDGLIPNAANREAVLEVKTAGIQYAHHWGKTYGEMGDADGVPEYYLVQLQTQMTVARVPAAYICVLIGGNDFRYYRVPHDPELAEEIDRSVYDFWRKYLMTGEAPPPSPSEEFKAYLRKRYPKEKDPIREAKGDEREMLYELAEVRARLKPLDDYKEELEDKLKLAIGDSAGLFTPFARMTYKWVRGKHGVRWEELARNQMEGYAEDEKKALIANFTRVGPGYRKIYFKDLRTEGEFDDE